MGKKILEEDLDELTDVMQGYDSCELCLGVEDRGCQNKIEEVNEHTICDECLEGIPDFLEWIRDGNVIFIDGAYSTQDSLYRNRLKGVVDLVDYYKKEFIN